MKVWQLNDLVGYGDQVMAGRRQRGGSFELKYKENIESLRKQERKKNSRSKITPPHILRLSRDLEIP